MSTSLETKTVSLDSLIARPDRYRVSVAEYIKYRDQGFLVVPQLVPQHEIEELRQHTDDLMQGRLPEQNRSMKERDTAKDGGVTVQELEAPPAHLIAG
jgi:hypothetical protein